MISCHKVMQEPCFVWLVDFEYHEDSEVASDTGIRLENSA